MSVLRIIILYINILDILMTMLNIQHNELREENQVWEELEKEAELLVQEKKDFVEAEEQLWLRISVAIEDKKQRNKELKQEVELLRRKCEELVEVLNRSNPSNPSRVLSQELNKDIEELETNNKTTKKNISELQTKKNDLEASLKELV
jgi:wyosine [tRNA(Phe)-imidazoG37] synthetase (radical SAM superfamily)